MDGDLGGLARTRRNTADLAVQYRQRASPRLFGGSARPKVV